MRRINLIDQANNQSEDSNEDENDKMILQVGGDGTSFLLEGKTNNVAFTTMIDSGSPISIFTQSDREKYFENRFIICQTTSKRRRIRRIQRTTTKLTGLQNCRRKGGKERDKEGKNSDNT